jgi:hypothetical protein
MGMLPKPLTLLLLVEKLKVNQQMSFLLPIMLSSLPLEPSRLDPPIKMLLLTLLKFAKLMRSTQFKVFSPIKLRNI